MDNETADLRIKVHTGENGGRLDIELTRSSREAVRGVPVEDGLSTATIFSEVEANENTGTEVF